MTPAVLFQVSKSWLWPPRFVCLSRLWVLVCLVTSFLLWIQKSCWFFICPAFSYYRDRSDNIQAVSMLELNLEVFHARIFPCIIIFNFLKKPVEYRHTWFYCFTLLHFADTVWLTLLQWSGTEPAISLKYACIPLQFLSAVGVIFSNLSSSALLVANLFPFPYKRKQSPFQMKERCRPL